MLTLTTKDNLQKFHVIPKIYRILNKQFEIGKEI
jgi:hypothetical protein